LSTTSGGTYWPKRPGDLAPAPRLDEKTVRHVQDEEREDHRESRGERQHDVDVVEKAQVGADREHQQAQRDEGRRLRREHGQPDRHGQPDEQNQDELGALCVRGLVLDVLIELPLGPRYGTSAVPLSSTGTW
jgi:hypothetical protein